MAISAPAVDDSDLTVERRYLGDVAPRPRWPHDDYDASLPRRKRLRRMWHQTWPVLLAVAVGILIWGGTGVEQWRHARVLFWLDIGLGVVALTMMPWRHRYPVRLAIAMLPIGALSTAATGALAAQLVAVARRRQFREIVPIGIAAMLCTQIYALIEPNQGSWFVQLTLNITFGSAYAAFGMYLGARTQLLESLRERAESAEREQALRVAQARRQERDRIAREMHDVLAHRLSLLCMHAGALSFRKDASQSEMQRSVDIIEHNAHQALADLREVIGVLRDREDSPGGTAPPQPTLCDVPALVDELRAAGMRIDVDWVGPSDTEPPASIGRSAYRIVQEALTNARKHAPGTRVRVAIGRVPGQQLMVRVVNPLPLRSGVPSIPGSGTGLQGLAERAAISGGDLDHGEQAGQFVLSARLPWPR